ncbi:hypothetical protein Tco_0217705 [Tanacetum coccineum]
MDITLTLSPITPLDVQFDTPSPSPPIVGHPIPWNLLKGCLEAGLREHLAPIECPDKILIGDQGGFGAWFANRV